MTSDELLERISKNNPPVVIDVRSGFEYNSGHIKGAIHAPSWRILLRIAKLPENKKCEIIVTCEHGPRAQMAAGVIKGLGYSNVALLEGHMSFWRKTGKPVEKA